MSMMTRTSTRPNQHGKAFFLAWGTLCWLVASLLLSAYLFSSLYWQLLLPSHCFLLLHFVGNFSHHCCVFSVQRCRRGNWLCLVHFFAPDHVGRMALSPGPTSLVIHCVATFERASVEVSWGLIQEDVLGRESRKCLVCNWTLGSTYVFILI